MDIQTGLLLFAAGIAGGIINALAGGATLITFPAMLAAGLPAIIANASNAVAISPGHLIAALADRGKLPPPTRRTISLVLVSTLGGAIGGRGALRCGREHRSLRGGSGPGVSGSGHREGSFRDGARARRSPPADR